MISRLAPDRRRIGSVLLAALGIAAPTGVAAAAGGTPSSTGPQPSNARARLEGQFILAGRITVADNIRGERKGDTVLRTWTFTPVCAHGACGHVRLVRQRSGGHDRVLLARKSPGYYTGTGSFYAPLQCGSRLYHRGQYVPFRITLRVTSSQIINGVDVATRLRTTYENHSRSNRTPCVAFLGHDSARYHGHLNEKVPFSGDGSSAGSNGSGSGGSGSGSGGTPPASAAAAASPRARKGAPGA